MSGPGTLHPDTSDRRRLTAIGFAVRHLTDSLRDVSTMPAWALHVVTTVLTKQLEPNLRADDAIDRCGAIVLDPQRPAWSTGTPAAELFGDSWGDIAAATGARIDATATLTGVLGTQPLFTRLARAAELETVPWWGTQRWHVAVDRHVALRGEHPLLESVLRTTPEYADNLTLSRVLARMGAVA